MSVCSNQQLLFITQFHTIKVIRWSKVLSVIEVVDYWNTVCHINLRSSQERFQPQIEWKEKKNPVQPQLQNLTFLWKKSVLQNHARDLSVRGEQIRQSTLSPKHWQIRTFAITEFNDCLIFLSQTLFSYLKKALKKIPLRQKCFNYLGSCNHARA